MFGLELDVSTLKTFLLPSGYQFNKFAQGGASALSGFVTLQTTILGHGPAQVCGLTLDLLLHVLCVVREANIIAVDQQLLHFAAPMGQRNPHAALKT